MRSFINLKGYKCFGMKFDKALKGRRSIRKYKEKKLSRNSLNAILDAIRYAPSAGNLQNWRLIVVEDENKKEEIAKYCFKQKWMTRASVIVVVCSDDSDVKRTYGDKSDMFCRQNCAAGIQNMLLKAYSIGIGSCWVGAHDDDKIKALLKMPDNINIEAVICFGHADENPEMPRRIDLRDIVHFEEWGNLEGD
jgi:nitroreductase